MVDWRIPRARIEAAIGAVRPGGEASVDELFARAVWGVLVEPGDGDAGALIGGIGAIEAARMVIDRASPAELAAATQGELGVEAATAALARWTERLRVESVLRSLHSAARCGARLIVPGDSEWSAGLDALGDHRPLLLWTRGDAGLLPRPGVALVGARAATGYGEHVAMELSAGLAARDVVVVSGGAYGIDGMAHRAALASGGATIAVMAGGIDRFYPSGHEALLTRIVEQGLVVCEVPCGTPPTRWRFLQRNRLIAALSRATVVVEAGHRSGALNTAHHAGALGRPIGAVPGPITSAASAGCHRIMRSELAAVCVTSAPQVMELAFGGDRVVDIGAGGMPADGGVAEPPLPAREHPMHVRAIDALRPRRGQTEQELARAVGESAEAIRGVLGLLSLDGRALCGDDGLWRRPEPSRARADRNVE